MKRVHFKNSILYIGAMLLVVTSSCKKGEDDPAFTLVTRKARVANEWKMKSGHLEYGVKDAGRNVPSYSYEFDGKNYTMTNYKGGHFSGVATLALGFEKKGAFRVKQQLDSLSYDANGTWDFQGKIGKYKKKEQITLRLDNINGTSDYYVLFNKSLYMFTYRIKELRQHKLVLVAEEEYIGLDQTGAGLYVDAEYVFTD